MVPSFDRKFDWLIDWDKKKKQRKVKNVRDNNKEKNTKGEYNAHFDIF